MTEPIRACARCAKSARWLVCADYGQGLAGQLMPYCDECRRDGLDNITACLPIALVEYEAEGSLLALFAIGATQSDPATFSESYWPGLSATWIKKAAAQARRWNGLLPST